MTSHSSPTPDWAVSKVEVILEHVDEPEVIDALMELLAFLCATQEQDKFKHEAAWAAIECGYKRTADLHIAARRYLGIAV